MRKIKKTDCVIHCMIRQPAVCSVNYSNLADGSCFTYLISKFDNAMVTCFSLFFLILSVKACIYFPVLNICKKKLDP